MSVFKPKPNLSLWQINKDTDNLVNQSKLEASKYGHSAQSAGKRARARHDCFTSDWMTKWRESLWCSNIKQMQMRSIFDTQVKTALLLFFILFVLFCFCFCFFDVGGVEWRGGGGVRVCVASGEDEIRLLQFPVFSPQWGKALRGQSLNVFRPRPPDDKLCQGPGTRSHTSWYPRLDIRSVRLSGAFLSFFLFLFFSSLTLLSVRRRTLYTSWSTRNRPIWMTSAPHWKWVHQSTQVIYFVIKKLFICVFW